MVTIVNPEEVRVQRTGTGWREVTLADESVFGANAMIARRWEFEPHAEGALQEHDNGDQLLYVIRGSGVAHVDGKEFALRVESVLWLEQGEQYRFTAGAEGLTILQGYRRLDK